MELKPISSFSPPNSIVNSSIALPISLLFTFRINDLLLNVGLRVDRYDANSKVLKDPYSLYAIRGAGDVSTLNGLDYMHPENIGNNYAVYVDDMDNPSSIAGYRNGDIWYDANGVEVSNPELIAQASNTGYITPYLVNSEDDIKSEDFWKNFFEYFNYFIKFNRRYKKNYRTAEIGNFFKFFDYFSLFFWQKTHKKKFI